MNRKRIFIKKSLSIKSGDIFIPEIEIQNYIFNVLRGKTGDKFEFFTKENITYLVKILDMKRREFYLEKVESKISKFKKRMVVLLPLMKGKKLKECSKKLVEIGVDKIIPIELEHSIKKSKIGLEEKLLTWCGEAAAQSGGIVPEIGYLLKNFEILSSLYTDHLKLLFDTNESINIRHIIKKEEKNILILTGPEGGFSEEERKKLKEIGFISIKLNSNILRCETAPVVALSILREFLDS